MSTGNPLHLNMGVLPPPLLSADEQAIDQLELVIKQQGIEVVDGNGLVLSQDKLREALNALLSEKGRRELAAAREMLEKKLAVSLPKPDVEALSQLLKTYAENNPVMPLPLTSVLSLAAVGRTDEQVMKVLKGRMEKENGERTEIRDRLRSLTAELRVFSEIQSKINNTLANKGEIDLTSASFNLLDPKLYGYSDSAWLVSPERRLLTGLDTYKGGDVVTYKDFLTGGVRADALDYPKDYPKGSPGNFPEGYPEDYPKGFAKASGQMGAKDLQDKYKWEKDNNPLANLSTAISDRSRTVNDKVTEQTTLLNDAASRNNTTIEALMKFTEKWFSMISRILQS